MEEVKKWYSAQVHCRCETRFWVRDSEYCPKEIPVTSGGRTDGQIVGAKLSRQQQQHAARTRLENEWHVSTLPCGTKVSGHI